MGDSPRRCDGCGNYLDPEDLFCANCGREGPRSEDAPPGELEDGFIGFDCESCGASVTYDIAAEGLRCSFCGSVSMRRQPDSTGRVRPSCLLPFDIGEEAAAARFRGWIGRGLFRPFGIREAARLVSLRRVFIPFWRFLASTHTYYTADTSQTPAFARADWCPVFGERSGEVSDVLVCASSSLRGDEVRGLEPFDFSRREEYRREALRDVGVEDFGLGRRGVRARARERILQAERSACAARVPGRSRNVHVNVLIQNLRSEPTLLPVWINAYRYRDEVYRFCVNGQTGKVVGNAPFSLAKLAIILGAAALVVLLVLLILAR